MANSIQQISHMNRIPLSFLAAVSATGMYCASVSAQEPAVGDAGSKMSAEQNTELAGLMLKMKKLPEAQPFTKIAFVERTDRRTGEMRTLPYAFNDMRFMQGRFEGRDGHVRNATFVFT